MIATAKCKIPLDLCLENPEWLPLVGCSGEGYPRQVCLDFPNLITSPACEGQNCTPCLSCLCPPLSLPFPRAILFLTLTNTFPPAHHNVYGAFSLEICLRFPSLLPKPACQGQSISLSWFQGIKAKPVLIQIYLIFFQLLWTDMRQPCLTAKTTSSSSAQGKCARNINSLSSANVRDLPGSVLSLLKIYFHTAVQNTFKPSEFE